MSVIAEPQAVSRITAENSHAMPPGYAQFLGNYQQVQALSPEAKNNLVKHDLGISIITPITGIVSYYDKRMSGKLFGKKILGNLPPTEYLTMVKEILGLDLDNLKSESASFDAYANEIVHRKVVPLRRCFPLLEASANFLDAPTPDKLQALNAQSVSLRDIGALYDIPAENLPDIAVAGPEAIIYVNLLSNAARHVKDLDPKSIKATANNGTLSVTNPSIDPLPATDIFSLGMKGDDSRGYGYGLFIAKHLCGPLAGVDIGAKATEMADPRQGPYRVEFNVSRNTK